MFYFKIALPCCLSLAFFNFESKINCTALPCLFSVHSGVAEQSFLSKARLALCLVRIALKLDAFASPQSLDHPVQVAPHISQLSKLSQES